MYQGVGNRRHHLLAIAAILLEVVSYVLMVPFSSVEVSIGAVGLEPFSLPLVAVITGVLS